MSVDLSFESRDGTLESSMDVSLMRIMIHTFIKTEMKAHTLHEHTGAKYGCEEASEESTCHIEIRRQPELQELPLMHAMNANHNDQSLQTLHAQYSKDAQNTRKTRYLCRHHDFCLHCMFSKLLKHARHESGASTQIQNTDTCHRRNVF